MSARLRSSNNPLIGSLTQGVFTNTTPSVTPAVLTAANANPSVLECDEFYEGLLFISVTAVSGTSPSLSLIFETSPDGVLWQQLGTITAITAVGNYLYPYGVNTTGGPFGYFVRLRNLAPTGTGSPKFTVAAWFLGK